jgi:hypothetical protein
LFATSARSRAAASATLAKTIRKTLRARQ